MTTRVEDSVGPCPICPNKHCPERIVRADGPKSARALLLGEEPAYNEHREGVPFVGLAGQDYNGQYLPIADVHRGAVVTANAVRCFGVGDSSGTPSEEEALACASHHLPRLQQELPHLSLIVPMGATAWSLYSEELAGGKGIDMVHGKLYRMPGSGLDIMPTRHPAAGLHQPTVMGDIRSDFLQVGLALAGRLDPASDPITEVRYELWNGESDAFVQRDREKPSDRLSWLSLDTEVDPVSTRTPWCVTFSCRPGSGYMVRAGNEELLAELEWMTNVADVVVMHHALYDRPILQRMGIEVPWSKIYDTMAAAWHRGLPQALKTLTYRLVNMEMEAYEDVVGPYAEAQLYEYLLDAAGRAESLPPPPASTYTDRHGSERKRRTAAHHKRLQRILKDWEKSDGKTDLLDRWMKDSLADTRQLLSAEGLPPLPETGIGLLPFDRALHYACADANAAGRSYLALESIEAPAPE